MKTFDDKKNYNIMDGNHRLKKAQDLSKKTIKSYVIPEQDILDSIKNGDLKLKTDKNLYKGE